MTNADLVDGIGGTLFTTEYVDTGFYQAYPPGVVNQYYSIDNTASMAAGTYYWGELNGTTFYLIATVVVPAPLTLADTTMVNIGQITVNSVGRSPASNNVLANMTNGDSVNGIGGTLYTTAYVNTQLYLACPPGAVNFGGLVDNSASLAAGTYYWGELNGFVFNLIGTLVVT